MDAGFKDKPANFNPRSPRGEQRLHLSFNL